MANSCLRSMRRCERLLDEILARSDVVEDVVRKTKKPPLIRKSDVGGVLDASDVAVVVGVDEVEGVAAGWTHRKLATASAGRWFSISVGQRRVGEHVAVVREEDVLALQVRLDRAQALADVAWSPVSTKVISQSWMSCRAARRCRRPRESTKSFDSASL